MALNFHIPGFPDAENYVRGSTGVCAGAGLGCTRICMLSLPTSKQVNTCLMDSLDSSFPTTPDGDWLNPRYYSPSCLVNSDKCPNCALLAEGITQLAFPLPEDGNATTSLLDPNSSRFLQKADIYLAAIPVLEAGVPVGPGSYCQPRRGLSCQYIKKA